MRKIGVLLLCAAGFLPAQTSGRGYGRSMTISRQGIVATSQILASEAGARILARGGSAADAAIAANAVLGVAEPNMCGMGGDLFALYWESKTGKLSGLNGSGPAPRALSPEWLARKGVKSISGDGIHSVTVPGAVDGWAKMHQRFGKLPWKELFDAAIAYAEEGFPVTEVIQETWAMYGKGPKLEGASLRLFLPGGKVPEVGEILENPDLGRAYRILAEKGPEAFYKGEIGAALLKTSERLGGAMTAEDLGSFSSEWVQPISTEYRGWRVWELPPNGQGMAALEMLNIMETFPAAADGPSGAAEMHKRIEAMKLAYADLNEYDADPRYYQSPVGVLISKQYAAKRAASIDRAKANCGVVAGKPVAGDTTYFTVVDREGNMASWIQSISAAFGSGIVVDGMGFLLHNRGTGFSLDPKSPNVLAGGKRPFHTIIPAFLERGDAHIGFGIQGGPNQPLAHAQFVSNMVDYGMNVQAAMESPRFTKATPNGCDVMIESRVPMATMQRLSEMGHQINIQREYTQRMGRGQAILHDSKTGTNYAASDPRTDGAAVPEGIR